MHYPAQSRPCVVARLAAGLAGRRRPAGRAARASPRGSVLIVAMLLAGVIGISLASYLKLAITSLRTANRSFYGNASIDYAEIGIEQAMACFYTFTTGVAAATAWNGWTLDPSTNTATRAFPTYSTTYTPGPGATAQVKVYVQNYNFAGTPIIVAKATITPADGPRSKSTSRSPCGTVRSSPTASWRATPSTGPVIRLPIVGVPIRTTTLPRQRCRTALG